MPRSCSHLHPIISLSSGNVANMGIGWRETTQLSYNLVAVRRLISGNLFGPFSKCQCMDLNERYTGLERELMVIYCTCRLTNRFWGGIDTIEMNGPNLMQNTVTYMQLKVLRVRMLCMGKPGLTYHDPSYR